MAKYNILGVKLAIEYFPYQELQDMLRLWGRKWLVNREKKSPEIEDIKRALKQAILYHLSTYKRDIGSHLKKTGNDGWEYFKILVYPRCLDKIEGIERKTAIYISYKASKGRSWTGCGNTADFRIKRPGTIYFRVLKNGKIERR